MRHTITLKYLRKLVVRPGKGGVGLPFVATMLKNIESLGFAFTPALIERVQTLSAEQAQMLYRDVTHELRILVGAGVRWKPMYPNFPAQVMEMSRAELYLNALIHYWTLREPQYASQPRSPLIEHTDLKPIDLGDEQAFEGVFRHLMGANTAISPDDKETVDWFVRSYQDRIVALVPAALPSKENLAFLAACLLRYTTSAEPVLQQHVKTATDVLRLAAALSGGDVSLAAATKFRGFRRGERRLLLGLLDRCANATEDMLRRPEPWTRLGERLHPGEWKRFPQAIAAFAVIRNDLSYPTFNRTVEQALAAHDGAKALATLRQRPGELARRLDHLLRETLDWQPVVAAFAEAAPKVATPVLLQVMTHFRRRGAAGRGWGFADAGQTQPAAPTAQLAPLRAFFPKGEVAKVQAIPDTQAALDPAACAEVVAICETALVARFRALPPLGKVFIDPRLRDYLVPFSQRSASKALRTVVRGSRLPLPQSPTIRCFLWWKEGVINGTPTGQVDIDLSAVIYDDEWKYLEHVSYTNLKSERYQAVHSGDYVTAPNGASEFIDLDVASVLEYGGRYVVIVLTAFTAQPFCNLPECFAGWMARDEPGSGEVYEPRTVQDRIDLASATRLCIPVILDVQERTAIWTDIGLRSFPLLNNVENNRKGVSMMGQVMTTLNKTNLYDLFRLHAQARGTRVDSAAAADAVFAVDQGVTPFDLPTIMAEYL